MDVPKAFRLTGLDLAHPMNGYRYHTKYDHIDYISMACLQRTGENVLELVKNIANSEELGNIEVFLIDQCYCKICLPRFNYCRPMLMELVSILMSWDLCSFRIAKELALF